MRRKNVVNDMMLHVENFDLTNIVLRQSEPIDMFCREVYELSDGTKEVSITDPVIMLLNQERLNSVVGNTALQKFVDSFNNQPYDPFAELRSKCSDDDLMKMVKSRHLQAPCEVFAWAKYMTDNIESFNKELQSLIDAQESSNQTTQVESSKTD